MAQPPLLALTDVRLTFGGGDLISSATLHVAKGDRIALVGRNGSGKSTLLKVLAGLHDPDGGERFASPGARVAYMEQDPSPAAEMTVRAYVEQGLAEAGLQAEAYRVDALAAPLGLDPERRFGELSGGTRRRAALARALAVDPDVLLLDEPTNHLDLPTIEWLEAELKNFRGALLVISHDRAFVSAVARSVAWIHRGHLTRYELSYRDFEARIEELRAAEEERIAKLKDKVARETLWLREGLTARRKRNMGRVRELAKLREELRAERDAVAHDKARAALSIGQGDRGGRLVVEAEGVSKRFEADGREIVVARDFDIRILRGSRVGFIGPNGAGKTTLVRMLIGDVEPDQGTVKLGTGLEVAYFDQNRESLDPEKSLWETLTGGRSDQVMVRGQPRHVVAYLRDFLFDEGQAHQKVKALSGGEKNRLLLAKLFARSFNLLVMDEPTNDLDIETLDLLEDVLSNFDGTLLLVSHDRDFLDRLVTSVVAVEGGGDVTEYVGGYSDYLSQRPARAASEAAVPKAKSKPKAKPRKKAPTKLSYKDARELDQLPDRIAALEGDLATLEAQLADPDAYSRDPQAIAEVGEKVAALRDQLAAAEDRWLELEEKREEIEAAAGRGEGA